MQRPASIASGRLVEELCRATGQRVERLERRPFEWWSTFPIEGITATLADGSTVELVLKQTGRASLDDELRAVKPELLDDPLRELHVYRDVLAGAGLGTACLYAGGAAPDGATAWLLLEYVDGDRLTLVGDPETWRAAVRWLARFHASHGGRTAAHVRRLDETEFLTWLRRAREFHDAPELARIERRYGDVLERLLALPHGLVHGEFYGSNIVVANGGGGSRVCPVDWELAGVGPQLIDLASMIVGDWTAEERDALVGAYHEEAIGGPPAADRLRDLDCCRLHLALQWLGWAPPPDPLHDADEWLREAVETAERVGIL